MPFVRLLFFAAALTVYGTGAVAQSIGPTPQRDVFVVGRDTAIGNPLEGFHPTRVEIPTEAMDISGRRDLTRMLLAELGWAHQPLPLGAPGLILHANGRLTVDSAELQKRLYEHGMCADRGDRIMVTDITVLKDRIQVDVNGGPYLKHRFLRHISVNDMPLAGDGQMGERPTGTRITLLFEGPTPRLTAAELKSLLEPVLDFGVKTSEQAYSDTLPAPIKKAIEEHEVLVGMNKRMVLAALGQPESKMRERAQDSSTGEVFEEWVYGHTPQTIRFVRFRGDRVILLKTAELGKSIATIDKDQLGEYRDPSTLHTIALGDAPAADSGSAPSLKSPKERLPDEKGTPRRSDGVLLPPSANRSPNPDTLPQTDPGMPHLTGGALHPPQADLKDDQAAPLRQ